MNSAKLYQVHTEVDDCCQAMQDLVSNLSYCLCIYQSLSIIHPHGRKVCPLVVCPWWDSNSWDMVARLLFAEQTMQPAVTLTAECDSEC